MTLRIFLLPFLTICLLAPLTFSQYGSLSKEDRILYTRQNPFDRFPDGRPRVPDDLLQRMKEVSIEEAWGVLKSHGYHNQFEGDWINVHPERILVGRAVTAAFMPKRPDMDEVTNELGKKDKQVGAQNSWVIDTLVENDVIVIDLFGKIKEGTFAGDNLSTSIAARSKTGMVIYGAVRDLDGIFPIPDFSVYVKGLDPTAIAEATLMGINIPIRIGSAIVMPGDIVLGRREGIIFVPPQLVKEVVEDSEKTRLRDEFGHQRLREGKYTPGQIDRKWTPEIEADFDQWKKAKKTN